MPLRCPNPSPSRTPNNNVTLSILLHLLLEDLLKVLLAKILDVEPAAAGEVDALENDRHAQAETAYDEEEGGLKVKTFCLCLL